MARKLGTYAAETWEKAREMHKAVEAGSRDILPAYVLARTFTDWDVTPSRAIPNIATKVSFTPLMSAFPTWDYVRFGTYDTRRAGRCLKAPLLAAFLE